MIDLKSIREHYLEVGTMCFFVLYSFIIDKFIVHIIRNEENMKNR